MKQPLSIEPKRMAALFIDLQEEHRRDERLLADGFERVLNNVARLQAAARRAGVALFHFAYVVDVKANAQRFHPVMADGTSYFSDKDHPHTALCPEVAPLAGEPLLEKSEATAFGAVSPEAALREHGIEWLLVAGVWTEACVDATVKSAIALGFRVLLVKDACASGTVAMHQTGILNLANRLYGGAVTDTNGACRLIAGETVGAWRIEGAVPLRFTFENAARLYSEL